MSTTTVVTHALLSVLCGAFVGFYLSWFSVDMFEKMLDKYTGIDKSSTRKKDGVYITSRAFLVVAILVFLSYLADFDIFVSLGLLMGWFYGMDVVTGIILDRKKNATNSLM